MKDVLQEISTTKLFLQSIGILSDKDETPTQTQKKAKKLIESVLKSFKIKYHFKKEVGDEGFLHRYFFRIDKKQVQLKVYVSNERKHIVVSLWDKKGLDLVKVLAAGPLSHYYAIKAIMMGALKEIMDGSE